MSVASLLRFATSLNSALISEFVSVISGAAKASLIAWFVIYLG